MKREKFMMPILAVNHFESIPRTPDRQTKKNVSIGEKKKKKFSKLRRKAMKSSMPVNGAEKTQGA